MIVLDSHCDTPSQVVRLRDLGLDNRLAHIDFPKLKAGKVDACFFALYTSQSKPRQEALPYVWKMLEKSKEAVEKCPYATLATSIAEVYENKAKGLISILFGMENGNPVGESVSELVRLYEAGVRYVTLTHNGDNQIADSASQGTTWNGLSPFGEGFVAKMNELGMIVDLAHASDKTFYDCLSASSTPIVSTHSCCRALANHPRIPKRVREYFSKWGTCRDEFSDGPGDGWQSQLYVREGRRMVGETVMTESHCRGEKKVPRPVAMAAYTMDSHHVRRVETADGFVRNEGNFEDMRGTGLKGRMSPYGIDYGSIVPKRGECTNLLVPVCLSASHVAFGSIRMEPVFFALGQAAGTAAVIAVRGGVAVQDVSYEELKGRLAADGQVLPDAMRK